MIWWVAILFLAGMMLILAEFIVPGMICGLIGAALVVSSAVLGCRAYPDYMLQIVLAEFLGAVGTVFVGVVLFPRMRATKRFILATSQQPTDGWVASESDDALMGAEGEVFTPLRPAGAITVNGKRVMAVSDGSFIERGVRVRITAVEGSRVLVEPASIEPEKGVSE